ncbi:HNH endonuclease [Salmonella enterica]|nr:HNH endonuclease [Salmonella enterica]
MNWHNYFYYLNGKPFWKNSHRGHVRAGDEVKNIDGKGYVRVVVRQKFYLAHRIIYEMHHGEIPEGYQVDHIDGDKLNNNIQNLRLATNSINQRNKRKSSRNTSGVTGVCFDRKTGKWVARICRKYLGKFANFEDACAARMEAVNNLGGFTQRHGQ